MVKVSVTSSARSLSRNERSLLARASPSTRSSGQPWSACTTKQKAGLLCNRAYGYGFRDGDIGALGDVTVTTGVDSDERIALVDLVDASLQRLLGASSKNLHVADLLAESFKSLLDAAAVIDEVDVGRTQEDLHAVAHSLERGSLSVAQLSLEKTSSPTGEQWKSTAGTADVHAQLGQMGGPLPKT